MQDNAAEESGETHLYRGVPTESRMNCQSGKSEVAPVEESQSVEPCDSVQVDNLSQQCDLRASSPQAGIVQLLQTVKIPAGYKIVKGQIRGSLMDAVMMFTSTPDVPALQVTDGTLEGDDGTLILENHGNEKLTLKQGTVVGTLTPVEEMGRRCGGRARANLLQPIPASTSDPTADLAPDVVNSPSGPLRTPAAIRKPRLQVPILLLIQ